MLCVFVCACVTCSVCVCLCARACLPVCARVCVKLGMCVIGVNAVFNNLFLFLKKRRSLLIRTSNKLNLLHEYSSSIYKNMLDNDTHLVIVI